MIALLRGHLLQSILYHPLVLYLAIALPALLIFGIFCKRKKKPYAACAARAVLFGGIGLLLIQWGMKVLLLFNGIDLLLLLDQMKK